MIAKHPPLNGLSEYKYHATPADRAPITSLYQLRGAALLPQNPLIPIAPAMSSESYDAFASAFEGDLVTPAHADYPAALHRWAANAERRAAIVAFARSAADVARALA